MLFAVYHTLKVITLTVLLFSCFDNVEHGCVNKRESIYNGLLYADIAVVSVAFVYFFYVVI